MRISRRWMLGALLGSVAAPALPVFADAPATSPRPMRRGGPAPVVREAQELVAEARLGGSIGFVVADANTGEVLEQSDGALPLPPASVAKAVTALYALEALGPEYRYATQILGTGPVVGGVVQGDLVLAGSGDPTLSTDALGDLAARLRASGVTGITGRYIAHAGALPAVTAIDAEQPDHVGYNPAISGLNLNYNRVYFEWRRAGSDYQVTMDARAERFVPKVSMARMQVVSRDLPVYTYAAAQGSDNWTVASTALGKGGSRWLPVRHPEAYAAEVFQTLAKAQGIELPAAQLVRVRPEGAVLASWESVPLRLILQDMLKFSTNLTAEVVGLTASGAGSLEESAKAMNLWAAARFGIAPEFHDHSGLGGGSRISAADMVTALVRAQSTLTGAELRGLLREVGLRDAKGREQRNAAVRVQAKTGTLNFVSGLAGHARAGEGRDMVFAIFCADPERRDRLTLAEREQPPGGRAWAGRARVLQSRLIERWIAVHG
ncbi:MAG: D-alanyl-D-alanine carboxypeptidase/D-alanyl-D-alanine-endopeptidase precursor [Cereibacter sp.]|jgi:D-alanyl-D-alanine carboxypeptidase/D-alanyl-D-alanine-endopeptidase (penicillin-binding protein 4)|nr:D-alanyl-D-alanine carboxypeptidase/D-alanyl-D-alanine-endopeptidase precursor [Cereibacter sp.]